MYLRNFDEFYAASEYVFRTAPSKTRYLNKYSRKRGSLVLKVTDDRVCLKYRTQRASDLRKLERLNRLVLSMMCFGPEAADDINQQEEQAAEHAQPQQSSSQHGQQQSNQQQQQASSSTGAGRRRGGKKKK